MTSRIYLFLACLLACAPAPTRSGDGMLLPTANGLVRPGFDEAAFYRAVDGYLLDRLSEVRSLRPGTTFAKLSAYFRHGGRLSAPPPHRFVHLICPFIKIDVAFEGKQIGSAYRRIPPDARVSTVSKTYFESPLYD